MYMIFTCPDNHYWVGNMDEVKEKGSPICPKCGKECNLGIGGDSKLFQKIKTTIKNTMEIAKFGVFVVAYLSHNDRKNRTNEVGRKLVSSIEEMNDVRKTTFADHYLGYETERNKPLSSGEDAERYLPPWYE